MDIESILLGFSYVGIFALMIVNGIVPFISSQILYIFVGYFVGTGFLQLFPASLIGASGNTVGNRRSGDGMKRREQGCDKLTRRAKFHFRRRANQ